MGDKEDIPIDSNPKELNKYYIIRNFGNYAKDQCEYCLTNKPIGSFQIIKFYVLSEDGLIEAIKDIPKDLCENCYLELKKNERLPPCLESLYSFYSKDPNECLNELQKYSKLSLTKLMIDLRDRKVDEEVVLDTNLEIERLKKLNTNEKANRILEFLTNGLFGYNIFGEMLYLDKKLYFLRYGRLIEADEIIEKLLSTFFNEIVTTFVLREFKLKLIKIAHYITKEEHDKKLNPLKYLRFKNVILNTITFDIVNDVDYYFNYEIPWEIDLDFFNKLKNDEIKEDYFKNCLFYISIRRFYSDENWKKLILALGSLMCLGLDEKRKIILIIGASNTAKSTLVSLLQKFFGNFAYAMNERNFENTNRYAFHFLMENKRIAFLSEKPNLNIKNVETIKAITGITKYEVENKWIRAKEAITSLRIVIDGNNIPQFFEYDEGLANRIFIIDTQNPLSETNKELINELEKEENFKDFVKFMLYCAWQYFKRKKLVDNEEEYSDYVMQRLRESKDFLKGFIEEYCIEGLEEYKEKRDVLYSAFLEYRKEKGLALNISKQRFYDAMRAKYKEVTIQGEYYFKGIELRKKVKESQEKLI